MAQKVAWPRQELAIHDEVVVLWPEAPVAEVDAAGRWILFRTPHGGHVYLQRYAWDSDMRPDFLIAWPEGEGAAQMRYSRLDEAVAALRDIWRAWSVAV